MTACQLATARQIFVDAEDKKERFALAGEAKALQRQERMESICSEQADAWMDQLRLIEKEKVGRVAAWEARKTELKKRRAQVLLLVDQRIAAANTLASAVQGVMTADEKKAKEDKEKAAEEEAAKEAKVAKEKEAERVERTKARHAAIEAFRQLDHTIAAVAKKDLPDLTDAPEAAKDAVVVLSTMFCWARASALGDSHLPFAFAEMGATAVVAKCLVGEAVWDAFFKAATVTDATICPMQLRQIVFLQLMTYEKALKVKKQAKEEEEATRILEESEPRLKRLRTLVKGTGLEQMRSQGK